MIDPVSITESGGEPEHPCLHVDDHKIYKNLFVDNTSGVSQGENLFCFLTRRIVFSFWVSRVVCCGGKAGLALMVGGSWP